MKVKELIKILSESDSEEDVQFEDGNGARYNILEVWGVGDDNGNNWTLITGETI